MRKRMPAGRDRCGIRAAAAAVASGGGGTPAVTSTSTAEPTGALTAWGFENADDVGQARLDYAEEQLERRRRRARRDRVRRAEVHHPPRQRRRARRRADGPALRRRSTRRRTSSCRWTRASRRTTSTPSDHWYPSVVDDVRYDDEVWAVPQFYQPPAILAEQAGDGRRPASRRRRSTPPTPTTLLAAIDKMYQECGGVPSRSASTRSRPARAGCGCSAWAVS